MGEAWQRYDAYTEGDRIVARVTTNDDEDRGYPTTYAEWDATYRDREQFLKHVSGGSHYGCSGVRVEVYLDGEEVQPRDEIMPSSMGLLDQEWSRDR